MTGFVTFLGDIARRGRESARAAMIRRKGCTLASAGAVASDKSRTPKRARKRAAKRAAKLEVLRQSQHNPAGSKQLRRAAKAITGLRQDYQEARDVVSIYRSGDEPRWRQGESKQRIALTELSEHLRAR